MNLTVRSLVSAIVAACLMGGSMSAAQAADPRLIPQSFTISGSGWGHGLGMSQYGARGMALEGNLYPGILEHYFQGSKVESTSAITAVTTDFKVGLDQDKKFIFLRGEDNPLESSSGGNLTLTTTNPTNTFAIAKDVAITFGISQTNTITIAATGVPAGTTVGSVIVSWDNAKTLANLESSAVEANRSAYLGGPCETAAASTDGKVHCSHRYKYGSLEIAIGAFGKDGKVADTTIDLNVVNNLRLADQYLYGIAEMPSSWPAEALKAQVVASRSFAYTKYLNNKARTDCLCTVLPTDGDQVFAGFIKEISSSGAQWKTAVDGTITAAGADVLIDNANPSKPVIAAYFSSSTGGKTQSRSEVWGTGVISWLTSVDDHWSLDPKVGNSNSAWQVTVSNKVIDTNLKKLGIKFQDIWALDIIGTYSSGAVSKLRITDSAGNITEFNVGPAELVKPDYLRSALGVKSTYLSGLSPSSDYVPSAIVANVKSLVAVTKINWPVKTIKPIDYTFNGKINPSQIGVTILLQEKVGATWVTIDRALTSTSGTWAIKWLAPNAGSHKLRFQAKNSKGTIKTSTKSITVGGRITLSAPKTSKPGKPITLSGYVSPRNPKVKVIIEKKIGYGTWKLVGITRTDSKGNWVYTYTVGAKRTVVAYRARTNDIKIGAQKSSSKITNIK